MNWPTTIPFGALRIRIKFVPQDHIGADELGEYKVIDGHPTVRIDENLESPLRDHVIFHELAHAYIDLSGITVEGAVEEAVCDAIAHGMMQIVGKL